MARRFFGVLVVLGMFLVCSCRFGAGNTASLSFELFSRDGAISEGAEFFYIVYAESQKTPWTGDLTVGAGNSSVVTLDGFPIGSEEKLYLALLNKKFEPSDNAETGGGHVTNPSFYGEATVLADSEDEVEANVNVSKIMSHGEFAYPSDSTPSTTTPETDPHIMIEGIPQSAFKYDGEIWNCTLSYTAVVPETSAAGTVEPDNFVARSSKTETFFVKLVKKEGKCNISVNGFPNAASGSNSIYLRIDSVALCPWGKKTEHKCSPCGEGVQRLFGYTDNVAGASGGGVKPKRDVQFKW
ncbi:MAG: hypothetical protein IKQ66_00245 [Treponema sp.]|nr:hypothetical protein [Treponema sp.]